MTKMCDAFAWLLLIASFHAPAGAQVGIGAGKKSSTTPKATQSEKPLVLTEVIPLENAKGRFDHFASNAHAKLFGDSEQMEYAGQT
jgi:hypothetical protein